MLNPHCAELPCHIDYYCAFYHNIGLLCEGLCKDKDNQIRFHSCYCNIPQPPDTKYQIWDFFWRHQLKYSKICLLENHHITRKKYFCNNCISFQYVHNNNYFPYSSVIRPFKPKVPSIKIKHQSYWVRHCSNTDEIFNFFVYSNWINNWCLTSL